MKVKYEYRVVIQEARVTRCNELEESEATYSEAISKNAAVKLLQCAMDCSEHTRLMHELERQALDAENKSCQDFSSHINLAYAMLHSPSRRIYIPLTLSY